MKRSDSLRRIALTLLFQLMPAFGVMGAVFSGGCQTTPSRTSLNEVDVFGGRESASRASVVLDPLEWSNGQRQYVELNESGAGETFAVQISAGDLVGRVRIAWGDERVSVLQVNADRAVLVGTIDRVNDAWTTFEPAPTWLLDERVDSVLREKFDVIVHSIRDSDRVVDRGTGTQEYLDEGDQWVMLLTGDAKGDAKVRCRRVRRVMTLDLGRADVESETIDWLEGLSGLVGEDASERVKVFGPLGWMKRRVFVLSGG